MLIILSQRIDTASEYADEAFTTYHYPARYKNQIHEGDTFVYYQGNRYVKEQRYYFGTGTVEKISTTDGENYYATLVDGQRFNNTVPIYLSDGTYVEQLGYDTVRKSPVPPWQSSVRPLSQQAFDYIISAAGIQKKLNIETSVEELKDQLKSQIRSFYLGDDSNAALGIRDTATEIIRLLGLEQTSSEQDSRICHSGVPEKSVQSFLEYCETTHITYSYKPVLIITFFQYANRHGVLKIDDAVTGVKQFYLSRRIHNLIVEKKKSIYLKDHITNEEIRNNLISNPIKALTGSEFFSYNPIKEELSFTPDIWPLIGDKEKMLIIEVCKRRLAKYYNG